VPDRDVGLGALYAAAHRGAEGAHPTEDALLALLGEADASMERDALLDHLGRCEECAAFVQHVGRCEECAAELGTSRPGLPEAARLRRRWAAWGGLAAAALVTGLWIGPFQSRVFAPTPPPDVVRGEAADVPLPLAPAGLLASPPAELRWQAVTGALSYQVRILDSRGEIVWSSPEVRGASLPWPGLSLAPGRYSWQVVARLADAERAASPTLSFELAGPP
jgi:hypothetical protein